MAQQGWNSPGTVVNDSSFGVKPWSTPEEADTSDNVYARCAALRNPAQSQYLKATNFGFSIPDGVTITGIVASIERYCTINEGAWDIRLRAVKGGVIQSTDMDWGELWSTSEHYVEYGASDNLWGTTWTPAQINASNFGLVLAAYAGEGIARVDHIRITVYYTEEPLTIMQINIGDTWKDVIEIKINIGDSWKTVTKMQINIGDSWKTIFG